LIVDDIEGTKAGTRQSLAVKNLEKARKLKELTTANPQSMNVFKSTGTLKQLNQDTLDRF